MTNQELALSIQHKLFADRPTIKDATDYAFRMINAMGPNEQIAATTALMVVLNTVAKEILKNEGVK